MESRLPAETVSARLKACRKTAPDLFTRNWSGPDEWRFAVYTTDDSYVGCVSVTDKARLTMGRWMPSKRERALLEHFCAAFNGVAS